MATGNSTGSRGSFASAFDALAGIDPARYDQTIV
jgi:hypothetical protein